MGSLGTHTRLHLWNTTDTLEYADRVDPNTRRQRSTQRGTAGNGCSMLQYAVL